MTREMFDPQITKYFSVEELAGLCGIFNILLYNKKSIFDGGKWGKCFGRWVEYGSV